MEFSDQNQPAPEAEKKTSHKKILSYVVITALVGLVFTLEVKRQEANTELAALTDRIEDQSGQGRQNQNREEAKKIVEKVRALITIPDDIEPTVATIIDVEALRERNPFYNVAENGDHLIVTTDRAIIVDADVTIIKDVVPVQIQPVEAAQ